MCRRRKMQFKILLSFLILQVGSCKAQQGGSCLQLQINLVTQGRCPNSSNQLQCADLCRGIPVAGESACERTPHCCFFNGTCLMRVLEGATPPQNISIEEIADEFMNNSDARSLSPGGGPLLPLDQIEHLFPYVRVLPKFPETCMFSVNNFQPQINIPYCQRIACQPGNPFLEFDLNQCISNPGCAFDSTLFTYRSVLSQGILPAVPVCHYAIRNDAFHMHARQFAAQNGGKWNPFLTECLINSYASEILTPGKKCSIVSALKKLGYKAKRAGWENISGRDCSLINGCWSNGRCYYPFTSELKTRTNYHETPQFDLIIHGKPMCQPFDHDISGGTFLDAYHSCLSSGCLMDTSNQILLQAIQNATLSSVPILLRQQYWTMALLGEVRADNWKQVRDRLINEFSSNSMFNRIVPSNAFSAGGSIVSGGITALPFTVSLNGSSPGSISSIPFVNYGAFGEFNNGNQPNINDGSRSLGSNAAFPPILNLQNIGATVNNQSNSLNILNNISNRISGFSSNTNNNRPIEEGRFSFHLPCTFKPIQWPNFPQLSGSFHGCCDTPKCYIPRIQIRRSLSEIASYTTAWTTWAPCSTTCGGGTQTKRRFCIGELCGPPEEEKRSCNTSPCPVYGPWSEYGSCSVTCGRGRKTRTRSCLGPGECLGPPSDTVRCRMGKCPKLMRGKWSPCSTTCGEGTQSRVVSCRPQRRVTCPPNRREQRPCKVYCGRGVPRRICDPQTCFLHLQPECLQVDGTPGYCRPRQLRIRKLRRPCYVGQCCNFHNPANRNVCRRAN